MIRFKRFFELAPDLLVLTDLDGSIRRVNPAWFDTLGHSPEELIGQSFFDLVVARDRQRAVAGFGELTENDLPLELHLGVSTADGCERLLRLRAVADDGRVYGAAHDITAEEQHKTDLQRAHAVTRSAHQAAVEAHREIEEWFRLVVANTNYIAYFQDRELRYTWIVNPAEPFAAEDLLGRTDREILSPGEAAELTAHKQAVLTTGEPCTIEISLLIHGERRIFESSLFPRRDRSDQVIGIAGLARDISQRIRSEQVEHREASVFRNLYDGVIITDENNRIIDWNPGAERLYGYSRDEALGKPPSFVQRHEIATEVTAEITAAIAEHGRWSGDLEFERKDGSSGISETICRPLRDRHGRISGTFGINRDITERKITEERLQAAKQAAEDANRAKSRFLANVSHEIRTPLNGIIGMANLVLTRGDDFDSREPIEVIRASAGALKEMLEDVLDLSKIEASKLTLESADFDVGALIGEVVALLRSESDRKQLELTVEFHDGLLSTVRGDAARFRQIVTNLLSNAVKFTHQGTITVAVASLADNNSTIELTITDTGIGISPEMQERIFDAFTQEDTSTTRRFGGTGLGLSICRRLVELMGGRLSLDSRPGKGSCFKVEIPFESAQGAQHETVAETVAETRSPTETVASSRKAERGKFLLLVVEDNEINQLVTIQILEHIGYRADLAANGQEALGALASQTYDLVLMDCQMPIMDGYEATRQWREREPPGTRLPIIAVTAYATPDHRTSCLSVGMDDHLAKPFEIDELAIRIDRQLGVYADSSGRSRPHSLDPEPRALLERLALRKGRQVVDRVVDLFGHEGARHIESLRSLLKEDDGEAIASTAHALRGSAASVGAGRISALCQEVENHVQRSDLRGLDALIESLEAELESAVGALRVITEEGPE